MYYGVEPLRRWLYLLRNVRAVLPTLEPKPYQTHSLRTFWSMLIPEHDLAFTFYVVTALVVLGMTVAVWRHAPSVPMALRFSMLLLATVLVAPHLTVYDLVVLAPAFLLLSDWLIGQEADERAGTSSLWLGTLLYLVYMLPLLGPFARWTHVQLSVIAMTAALYVIWRVSPQARPQHVARVS